MTPSATPRTAPGPDLRRSIGFSMLDKYLSQLLAILTTLVMARLLTPAETGIFVVGQALILLAENFRDFGIGAYLVQMPVIDRHALRAAFAMTMALSLVMACLILAFSAQIAGFYDTPALEPLLHVALIGFFIMPFGTPGIALLRREMAFRTLACLNISVAMINAGVTVGLGLTGHGAISYIWGYVVSNAWLALIAFALRPHPWMFLPSLRGMRPLLRFGVTSAAVTVANMAYDLLPRLLFGKVLGLDAAGLYARAVTICQLPDRVLVAGVQPVLLPAMAASLRRGDALKPGYLRGHQMMSGLQWPAFLMLALLADPVVALLLGPQWGETAPLVRIMALAMMTLAPAFLTFPTLVAAGRIGDALTATLIALPPSVLILALAVPHGLWLAVASTLLVSPLQMLVALIFIRRAIGLTPREMWDASRQSLIVTLCTAVLPGLVVLLSPTGFAMGWGQMVLAILGGAMGWFMGIYLSGHPIHAEASQLTRRFLSKIGGMAFQR